MNRTSRSVFVAVADVGWNFGPGWRLTGELGVDSITSASTDNMDVGEIKVDTPYGAPSDSLFLAVVGGRRVAFLTRHGRRHTIPPLRINYHASMLDDLTYTIGVTVGVELGDLGQAQAALDYFLAPSTIVAALEEPIAGDGLHSVQVIAMTTYSTREMGGKSVLTAGFEVEIYA